MKKILLVDDSPTVLASMRQVLERAKYVVEAQINPDGALAKLNSGYRPDLVITDLIMPGMDGIQFITAARRLPPCRFIPMLVLTTESGQAQRDRAKTAGATGWLVKPVASEKLFDVLRQVLA